MLLLQMKRLTSVLLACFLHACAAQPDTLEPARPESVGMSTTALARIDGAVQQAIQAGDIPGATIEVIHQGKIAYRAAFGARALYPVYQANSLDTIYDLASMTKPIGTATAVMKLVEEGKIRLWDRVAVYDPAFHRRGKQQVTVEELLDHSAGLPSALNESESVLPEATGEQLIDNMPLHFAPGSQYEYCNTCFIELAKIVRVVSGKSIGDFDAQEIFAPMGIAQSMFFDVPASDLSRTSPEAEVHRGRYLLGKFVIAGHGPIGAIGHAGLFSTVDGVAAYAQMLLNHGHYNGAQILSPTTVAQMIAPHYLGRSTQRIGSIRGLGWDEATTDSSNRGELFSFGGYGHTGSTGCSLWIDPATETAVIFLSNAAHVKRDNDDAVVRLYGRISTLAAAAIQDPSAANESAEQAAAWGAQVAAQAAGFEQWATEDRQLWKAHHYGTQY